MDSIRSVFEPSGRTLNELGDGLGYHGPTATKRAWLLLYRASDPRISTAIAVVEALRVNISDLVKRSPSSRLSQCHAWREPRRVGCLRLKTEERHPSVVCGCPKPASVAHLEARCRGVMWSLQPELADRSGHLDRQRLNQQAPCAAYVIAQLATRDWVK